MGTVVPAMSAEQRLAALQRQVVAPGAAGAEDSCFRTSSRKTSPPVRLHYRDTGPRSAPTVVFIAGVGGRMDAFDQHVEDLCSEFRCIQLDNRGVGGSDKPTEAYTIDDMARDVLELLCNLTGGGAAHVVGQSMGGMIAQRMAVLAPKAVLSLALCSTVSWCDGRTDAYWASLPLLARHLPPENFTRAMLPWMVGKDTLEDPTHPFMRSLLSPSATAEPTPPHTYEIQVETMLAFDSRPWLQRIRAPTLVTVGTADIGTPPYQSEYLVEHIAGARLHQFEGAGHRALNEQHEAFTSLLRGWLNEHSATATSAKSEGEGEGQGTSNEHSEGVQVGFVGLGNMGGAIVRRMLRSGSDTIIVHDQVPAAFERLCEEVRGDGGSSERLLFAGSAKEVAERCDVTCSMVPGDSSALPFMNSPVGPPRLLTNQCEGRSARDGGCSVGSGGHRGRTSAWFDLHRSNDHLTNLDRTGECGGGGQGGDDGGCAGDGRSCLYR